MSDERKPIFWPRGMYGCPQAMIEAKPVLDLLQRLAADHAAILSQHPSVPRSSSLDAALKLILDSEVSAVFMQKDPTLVMPSGDVLAAVDAALAGRGVPDEDGLCDEAFLLLAGLWNDGPRAKTIPIGDWLRERGYDPHKLRFVAGRGVREATGPSDAEVEAAAKAMYERDGANLQKLATKGPVPSWEEISPHVIIGKAWRIKARAVLDAALAVRSTSEGANACVEGEQSLDS